jgi:hypothetical protein
MEKILWMAQFSDKSVPDMRGYHRPIRDLFNLAV